MKIDEKVSADIIDRRRGALVGSIAAAFAVVAAWFGLRAPASPGPDRDLVAVVSTALDRGQVFWGARIPGYRRAKVVLYADKTSTACGVGETASGPFYCPADERIYIDLSFLRAIRGDLARAYVIAHELGHHVQKMRHEDGASVPIELEADCYAGAFMAAENAAGHLDGGDIPSALAEAAAVGDDRLCPTCSVDSFTHGSAAQRDAAVEAGISGATCHL